MAVLDRRKLGWWAEPWGSATLGSGVALLSCVKLRENLTLRALVSSYANVMVDRTISSVLTIMRTL
jgi:phage gp46-like protein